MTLITLIPSLIGWLIGNSTLDVVINIVQARLGLWFITAAFMLIKGEKPEYSVLRSTPRQKLLQLVIGALVIIVPFIIVIALIGVLWFSVGGIWLSLGGNMGGLWLAFWWLLALALMLWGIFLAIRLSLFQFYIVEGYDAISALKASWFATKDDFWKLLLASLTFGLIALVGALLLYVGLLVALPLIILSQTHIFNALKANAPKYLKKNRSLSEQLDSLQKGLEKKQKSLEKKMNTDSKELTIEEEQDILLEQEQDIILEEENNDIKESKKLNKPSKKNTNKKKKWDK